MLMLILASNSPRRKQLLALGGWSFRILAPSIDESALSAETPEAYVQRLAESKAKQAMHLLETSPENPMQKPTLIIAADTTVADQAPFPEGGWEILGKPADNREAEAMLRRLRGRTHRVHTALAVLRVDDQVMISQVVSTDVPMRNYTDQQMLAYIASGDPLDKAGAYAIQHPDFKPVDGLRGCYANVMGLPVCHLQRILAEFGIHSPHSVATACQQAIDYPCPVFRQVLQDGAPGEL